MINTLWLATKTIKIRQAFLPMLGFAIFSFCLCFAGATNLKISGEKAEPYELIMTSTPKSPITDKAIAEVIKIDFVKKTTPVIEIPVRLKIEQYSANLTLIGINAEYFEGLFLQGGIFPTESAMPYILLNEAACKLMTQSEQKENEEVIIDWLRGGFEIIQSEDQPATISKVCGIFSDAGVKDAEPRAYISIYSAKQLLVNSGKPIEYSNAFIRTADSGKAVSVSKAISSAGYLIANSNDELHERWETQTNEIIYLLVVAVFALCSAILIIRAYRIMNMVINKQSLDMLQWMGVTAKMSERRFLTQDFVIMLSGFLIGTLTALTLPSFLMADGADLETIYLIKTPFSVIAITLVINLIAILSFHFITRKERTGAT